MPVEVETSGQIDMAEIVPGAPIVIGQVTGTIEGSLYDEPADLHFSNLTIKSGDVTAVRLIIDDYLELRDYTKLQPPTGEAIMIAGGAVVKFVASSMPGLPYLNLGSTAGAETVPARLEIVVSGGYESGSEKLIVSGEPFGKCDEWKNALYGIPSGVRGFCEGLSTARRVQAGPVGLYLKSEPKSPDGGGLPQIVIIVVVAVVVVIVLAAAAGGACYCFCVRKRDDKDKECAA
jgi:hypothetical protein